MDLVLLDVSVLDEERMPVRGLAASDFTVLEDGRPQVIAAFSEIDLPDQSEMPESAMWTRSVAPDVQRNADFIDRRVIVIVMDDATPMPAAEIPLAKRVARSAIESLGANDVAAVVYAWNKGAGQEFTRDRARLQAAVDRFNGGIDLTAFDSFDTKAASLYLAAVNTVRVAADYLADLPDRRKALIWVSVGVPIDWEMAQAGMISLDDPGSATRSGVVQGVIKSTSELLAAAQHANVTIYGLSPGGLRAPSAKYDALSGSTSMSISPGKLNQDFLSGVSAGTGGFAIVDVNDPREGIGQVLRENASYYLLGYVSPNPRTEGRFRRLEVRVSRPHATVRARNGYFEARTSRKKVAAAPAALDAALAGIIPRTDLDLQLSALPFPTQGGKRAEIALVLGVRQEVPTRATQLVTDVDLRVAAFSRDGQLRASHREKVPVTLNRPGFASTVGFEVLSHFELAPGRYYLRVAAGTSAHGVELTPGGPKVALIRPGEEPVSKSGSVYCDLEVPDFSRAPLSLSGVAVSVEPGVVSGPKDALASIVPLVPTTLRQFEREDGVKAFVRAYQGGNRALVPVALETRIRDARDMAVFTSKETLAPERFAGQRAADYRLDLPIAMLARGSYLLTIEATAGDRSARRDVRFEVR